MNRRSFFARTVAAVLAFVGWQRRSSQAIETGRTAAYLEGGDQGGFLVPEEYRGLIDKREPIIGDPILFDQYRAEDEYEAMDRCCRERLGMSYEEARKAYPETDHDRRIAKAFQNLKREQEAAQA